MEGDVAHVYLDGKAGESEPRTTGIAHQDGGVGKGATDDAGSERD